MAKLSYRMLQIGGAPAGLLGLDEVFDDLFAEGCDPGLPETKERLLKEVRQHNSLPNRPVKNIKVF